MSLADSSCCEFHSSWRAVLRVERCCRSCVVVLLMLVFAFAFVFEFEDIAADGLLGLE